MRFAGMLCLMFVFLAGCGDAAPDEIIPTSWFQKYSKIASDHNQKNSLFQNMYASLIVKGTVEEIDEKRLVLKNIKYLLCPSSASGIYDHLNSLSVHLHKSLVFIDGYAPLRGERLYVLILNGPSGRYDFYLQSAIRYSREMPDKTLVYQMDLDPVKYFSSIQDSFAFPMIRSYSLRSGKLCIVDLSGKEHLLASGEQWVVRSGEKTFVYSYCRKPESGKHYLDFGILSGPDISCEYPFLSSARLELSFHQSPEKHSPKN